MPSLKLLCDHKEAEIGGIFFRVSVDQIQNSDQSRAVIKPDIVFRGGLDARRRNMKVVQNQRSRGLFAAILIVLLVLQAERKNVVCVRIAQISDIVTAGEL